jgi:hypothetical protein
MPIRVVGDILEGFSVELDISLTEFSALPYDEQEARVAEELGIRRFGAERGLRIDEIEEA